MKARERVISALELEEPDRVPSCEFWVSPLVLGKTVGKDLLKAPVSELIKAHIQVGLDCASVVVFWNAKDAALRIGADRYVDRWGRISDSKVKSDTMSDFYVGGFLTTPEKYDEFPKDDPCDAWRVELYEKTVKAAGDDLFIVPLGASVFEIPAEGIGYENYFRYLYTNPSFLERVRDYAVWFSVEVTKSLIDSGAEVILLGDDFSYHSGLMISPAHFRRFILPGMKKIADTCHKRGALTILHSCGNMLRVMPDIIEAGIDAIHPLEPTAGIDLEKVKGEYGHSICLIGNIDINTLSLGTPRDVAEKVKKAIRAAAVGGGYMLGSAHSAYDAVKAENFRTQIIVTKKFGKYPICAKERCLSKTKS